MCGAARALDRELICGIVARCRRSHRGARRALARSRRVADGGDRRRAPASSRVYECDGYTLEQAARPRSSCCRARPEQVAAVVRLLHRARRRLRAARRRHRSDRRLPAARRAGDDLHQPHDAHRRDRPRQPPRRRRGRRGQPRGDARRARRTGCCYAPDPSSQTACTIGGNVAENSGGPHTLKYGVTTNHVLGVELVLPDGEVVELGGAVEDVPGLRPDRPRRRRRGHVRHRHRGDAAPGARSRRRGGRCSACSRSSTTPPRRVSGIIAAGIVPAALEMMDQLIVEAVEAAFHFGFPTDAGAVLIVELDGPAAGLDAQAQRVVDDLPRARRARGARRRDEAERAALWKSRKRAFGAVGRLAPNYCTQDGVVPRTKLPEILRAHQRDRRALPAAHRQRLPRRRRQHPSDPAVRRARRRRGAARARRRAARSSTPASSSAAASPASTASASRRSRELPLLFSPQDLLVMQAAARASSIPSSAAIPARSSRRRASCVEVTRPRRQAPV